MIESFQGKYRFLSNFWPVTVVLDSVSYPSVENAYQAAKTLDLDCRKPFVGCTPWLAKRWGRKLDIRVDWDAVKVNVMRDLLSQKFSGGWLMEALKGTGSNTLIEGNTWGDTFWGVCKGAGENNLGNLLMKIRSEL